MSPQENSHLSTALSGAIPLWILQYQKLSWEELQPTIAESAEVLFEKAEALIHKVPGDTADAFNALARAIAAISFCPGGIQIFGCHWESKFESDEPKTHSKKRRKK